MKNYKLVKEVKGKKFLYQIIDNENNLISQRESSIEYVACTSDGRFYFKTLKAIKTGLHKEKIAMHTKYFNRKYSQYVIENPSWSTPTEKEWLECIKYAEKSLEILNTIIKIGE